MFSCPVAQLRASHATPRPDPPHQQSSPRRSGRSTGDRRDRKAQRWDPVEVITTLFVEEITRRSRPTLATRRKAAGFPTGRTFATRDTSVSSIPAPTPQAPRTLKRVGRKKNLVVCGPSVTGAAFFIAAFSQHIVEAGMRVAWFRIEDLGAPMRAPRSADSVTRVLARIPRDDLVAINDMGLLPVGIDAAKGLYRLVDTGCEKRPVAISSNLHRQRSTSSYRMPSPQRLSTGFRTMPTTARPEANPSASPRPSLAKQPHPVEPQPP